ncbi:MAG: EAL domain-containing protein [Pseudomonadota bacterium]
MSNAETETGVARDTDIEHDDLAKALTSAAGEIAARLGALVETASGIRRALAPRRDGEGDTAPQNCMFLSAARALRDRVEARRDPGRDAALMAIDTVIDGPPPIDPAVAAEIGTRLVAMRKARQTLSAASQAADQMAQRVEHIEAALSAAAAAETAGVGPALQGIAAQLISGLAEDLESERAAVRDALTMLSQEAAHIESTLSAAALPSSLQGIRDDDAAALAKALSDGRRTLAGELARPDDFGSIAKAADAARDGVSEPLAETVGTLRSLARGLAPTAPLDAAAPAIAEALSAQAAIYTMDRERQLHDRAVAALSAPPEQTPDEQATHGDAPLKETAFRRGLARLEADPRTGFALTIAIGSMLALVTAIVLGFVPFKALLTALGVQAAVALLAGLHLHFEAERRLQAQREDTERMVFHDALTSTLNRRGMMRLLDGLLGTGPGPAKGPGSKPAEAVAALHVDLDHFKSVNDTLGHEAGDYVLEIASARMAEAVGKDGAVCRVGGDEFCTVLWAKAATEEGAKRAASRIVESAKEPIETPAGTAQIGASIGIALWTDAMPASPGRLLADADLATYVSKSEGRGRWSVFDAALREQAETEARVARALARALAEDKDAIQVWLQPVVDTADGSIVAAEALMRWFDPELGEIPPEAALPAAERSNLLDAVEEHVLDRTLAATALLQARDLAPQRITLNLDRVGLRRHGLAERMRIAAEKHGVAPSQLGVEVPEEACGGRGADLALGTLADLRASGISVVIDRLGRDQVSLAGLTAIKAGEAKLDRGLVGQIGQDGDGRSLLQGLVTLSRSLDLRITASGVETREQLAVLRDLGVDSMQGFAIARPMAPDAFAEWVDFGQSLARTG